MFGFSLTKLLFTVAVVVFIWYGFKWVGRLKARRDAGASRRVRDEGGGAEDMVECAACGDYVSARAAIHCGRPECPYPG